MGRFICEKCGKITATRMNMCFCPQCGHSMKSMEPLKAQTEPVTEVSCSARLEAAALAKRFHETYERLAPRLDYKTRHESAVPWHKVPDKNKMLMIAVCEELLKEGI